MVRITVSSGGGIESISTGRTSYSPRTSNRFQPLSGSQSAKTDVAAKPGLQRANSWPKSKVSLDMSKNTIVRFEVPNAMKPTKLATAPAAATAAAAPAKPASPKAATPAPVATATVSAKTEKGGSWSMPNLFSVACVVAKVAMVLVIAYQSHRPMPSNGQLLLAAPPARLGLPRPSPYAGWAQVSQNSNSQYGGTPASAPVHANFGDDVAQMVKSAAQRYPFQAG
jgi:hypothetical protein